MRRGCASCRPFSGLVRDLGGRRTRRRSRGYFCATKFRRRCARSNFENRATSDSARIITPACTARTEAPSGSRRFRHARVGLCTALTHNARHFGGGDRVSAISHSTTVQAARRAVALTGMDGVASIRPDSTRRGFRIFGGCELGGESLKPPHLEGHVNARQPSHVRRSRGPL